MRGLLCVFLAATSTLVAETVTYRLQPTPQGRLALTVEKTGFLSGKKHLFLFQRYTGTLWYDVASPELSRVELRIDSGSAVCMDTWVSAKDLRKIQKYALEDMLAAERYPDLWFRSTRIMARGPGSFEVTGALTIRGIDKPVTVLVEVTSHSGKLSALAGQATVRMKDYGLKPPTAALGTIGTKNEMAVSFFVEPELTH